MERALKKESVRPLYSTDLDEHGRLNTETLGVQLINKNERAADHVQ
jgi:hypothetical protein